LNKKFGGLIIVIIFLSCIIPIVIANDWSINQNIQPITLENIQVSIEQPLENSLYILDRKILTLPRTTVIIGDITVKATINSTHEIDRLEFHIDDELKNTETDHPSWLWVPWKWDKAIFLRHTIKVVAYDNLGNNASDEIEVLIFNMGINTLPTIKIDTIGRFRYDPTEIETVRNDIFREGHFSLFDVLIYLDSCDSIDMEYHFDEAMNTHIIDSINGKENWWYRAHYDGGWWENTVFRMDHYLIKEKTSIEIMQKEASYINQIYDVYREEIERLNENNGKVIIPEVIIEGKTDTIQFTDVEVQPHNLRSDIFQPDVITAIDVILTLGDEGNISYDLQWYDTVGTAGIVRSYYVQRIDDDESYDRCGFVYEEGSYLFEGFQGNHVHILSDIRVINSPEYEKWFWICI
jgi:hypothetical protein